MQNQSERLQSLVEINRQLSRAANTTEYLNGILVAAADLTDSDGAAILEYDEQAALLRFLALAGLDQKALEALETVSVPLEGSVAGTAFASAKPLIVQDVRKIKYHFKNADEVSGFETHSILAVPITFHGQVLGVFEVINKSGPDYTGDDATILEVLCVQAAVAIQNVRLQRLLTQTREDAERLNRMKSDFIAITSHELRTPLGLILGHSTFLREVIDEEHHAQMDTIIRNAMRLKEIIENMTNADNAQSGTALVRRRSVSLKKLIQELMTTFVEDAKQKNIALNTDLGDNDDLMVEGDTEKIGIAISNLIKNAIAFTNEKGHIFVVAERVPGYVKVSVIDDGIGIPPESLSHIFERFYQVESHLTRKHGGMGLGLSVTKMMVEMHGGRIWAESMVGKGSNFTMLLPLDSSQAEALGKVFTA